MRFPIPLKILFTMVGTTLFIVLISAFVLLFSFNNMLQNNTRDGTIVITEENKKAYVQHAIKVITLLVVSLCTLAALMSRIVAYFELKPIRYLQQAVEEITKGNLDVEIKIIGGDEITDFAMAFKHMTEELRKSSERLRTLLRVKSQFVNQVAHDLRTPLVPILGLLPLVKDDLKNGATDDNLKMINTISNNASYLSILVRDTLSISKLDENKVEFSMQGENIRPLIEEVIDNNQLVFTNKHITVTNNVSRDLPPVFIDKVRIVEVFENLIMNATKFMHEHKAITFSATVQNNTMQVSVTDTGIGIPKEHLHKVFEEFHKVDASRHQHSSGLGLAICKRIIHNHKGDIWVESKGTGTGSAFIFTLPIHTTQKPGKIIIET